MEAGIKAGNAAALSEGEAAAFPYLREWDEMFMERVRNADGRPWLFMVK